MQYKTILLHFHLILSFGRSCCCRFCRLTRGLVAVVVAFIATDFAGAVGVTPVISVDLPPVAFIGWPTPDLLPVISVDSFGG